MRNAVRPDAGAATLAAGAELVMLTDVLLVAAVVAAALAVEAALLETTAAVTADPVLAAAEDVAAAPVVALVVAVAAPPHAESNAAPALPRARTAVVRKTDRLVHMWYSMSTFHSTNDYALDVTRP
jgi:hypothetical protein